jgi:hypothetical protein
MRNTLVTAILVGLVASMAFILVQPLFGMATLTSRHAAAYMGQGGYGAMAALVLSWLVHVGVSIFYALLSTVIFQWNASTLVSLVQVVALGWITTLIATPANEWVVRLVTTARIPEFSSLAAVNTQVGPKLWLHMLFFVFVLAGLWLARRWRQSAAPALAVQN